MSRQGGGKTAVFGNSADVEDGAASPPSAPPASPPAAPPSPAAPGLAGIFTAATREVAECEMRVSGVLQDTTGPNAGLDAGLDAASADSAACTENKIHEAYVKLINALYAQRRAAVRIYRARKAAAKAANARGV
ncbi:MAG: hypothetical protein J4F28_02070 [Nitrosopumilaceae archaeon]|nr:hypothetical protein [Nitrosopumilaceae archaeon]